MSGEKRFNVTSLRDSGKGMTDVGDKVRAEWEKLKGEAEDLDGIFGNNYHDDVGSMIRMAYEAVHGLADEAFTSAADDFGAFGEALTRVGDRNEEIELFNKDILEKINADLDSVSEGR
jgi:hypothetical protein